MYTFALTRQIGQETTPYVFASLFNPGGSGVTGTLLLAQMANYAVAGSAIDTIFNLTRITAASGGTLQAASAINKFRTSDPNTALEVRTDNPTVTTGAHAWNYTPPFQLATPGAVSAREQGVPLLPEWDRMILAPGEGVAILQESAGDVDQRINIVMAWRQL